MVEPIFLPGVPEAHIRRRLEQAGGDELGSGKFRHRESSAALAANAFGWFIDRPERLPPLGGLSHVGSADSVDIEYCAPFPWQGGRHPWPDAVVTTASHLVGVESKRFEPFRDPKTTNFSQAYIRHDWGRGMEGYGRLRDALQLRRQTFKHLDAAQLIKHAYGLLTQAASMRKRPALFYIYAEPKMLPGATALGARPLYPPARDRDVHPSGHGRRGPVQLIELPGMDRHVGRCLPSARAGAD